MKRAGRIAPPQRGASRVEELWGEPLRKLRRRAGELRPRPMAIRKELKVDRFSSRVRLHLPLLAELLNELDVGGQVWRRLFIEGLPMFGHLADMGVYPVGADAATPISRAELSKGLRGGWNLPKSAMTTESSFGRDQ